MLSAAENTYQRALNIFTNLRDTLNLSTVYNENGVVYEHQKNYDKALAYYKQSLDLKRAINDSVGMAYAYNFISGAYLLKNKNTEAEEYSLKSLNLFEALRDSFSVSLVYTDLAKIYLSAGKEALAKQAAENSNAFAQKTGYLDLLANNQLLLAEISKKQNNFSEALKDYELYTKLKDSLYTEQMQKAILELNTKYEVAQKDKDILEKSSALRIKNILLISGLIGIGLLSILFFVTYRSSKLKHKTQLQKTIIEQQDFAAKSIIEAEENERQRMSSNLHDGLGQLLSAARMNIQAAEEKFAGNAGGQNSYNNIMSLIDDSIKEMRSVTHQMMPGAFVRQGLGGALKNLIEKLKAPH
ncbi:MAG: tetratricopeptide repeat protein [Sphingobacteriales bacterium]|nr:tetratricopeptide repeat protein [Sphingobacteriales bacterium]